MKSKYMKVRNKDGTKTLEWLEVRKLDLETLPSVKWYLKFMKKSPEFRKNLIKKYNDFLEKVPNSRAFALFQEIKEAYISGNRPLFDELVFEARERLINEDYEKAPALYDPQFIQYDFFVKQYLEVIEKINAQKDAFTKSVEETLL